MAIGTMFAQTPRFADAVRRTPASPVGVGTQTAAAEAAVVYKSLALFPSAFHVFRPHPFSAFHLLPSLSRLTLRLFQRVLTFTARRFTLVVRSSSILGRPTALSSPSHNPFPTLFVILPNEPQPP